MGITQPASVARNRDKASFSKLSEIKGHEVFRVDTSPSDPSRWTTTPNIQVPALRAEGPPTGSCHLPYDLRFPEFYLGGPIGREGRSA